MPEQPTAAQPPSPRRRRFWGWGVLVGVLLLIVLSLVWLKADNGLRGRARRAWKDQAIAEIARRADDSRWLASELEVLKTNSAVEPDRGSWISAHVLQKAGNRLLFTLPDAGGPPSPRVLLMKNGERIVYANICRKEDHRIPDLFIGRGSDGKWYYSTFHFCRGACAIAEDEQPKRLAKFVARYCLKEFDGRSDECLAKTWPPTPEQAARMAPRTLPQELEPLTAALRDADEDVRRDAAYALGELKYAGAVEPLIAALKDDDEDVRGCAAVALGKLKDPRAVEPLTAALKDPNSAVREGAASALYGVKDLRIVEPLIAALKDTDSSVCAAAAWTLGETRDPRAVEPLASLLGVSDISVRRRATGAFGKLHDPRVIEPLIAALKDSDAGVRKWAALSLGELKEPRAVEPLKALLSDPDSDVRRQAEESLRRTEARGPQTDP